MLTLSLFLLVAVLGWTASALLGAPPVLWPAGLLVFAVLVWVTPALKLRLLILIAAPKVGLRRTILRLQVGLFMIVAFQPSVVVAQEANGDAFPISPIHIIKEVGEMHGHLSHAIGEAWTVFQHNTDEILRKGHATYEHQLGLYLDSLGTYGHPDELKVREGVKETLSAKIDYGIVVATADYYNEITFALARYLSGPVLSFFRDSANELISNPTQLREFRATLGQLEHEHTLLRDEAERQKQGAQVAAHRANTWFGGHAEALPVEALINDSLRYRLNTIQTKVREVQHQFQMLQHEASTNGELRNEAAQMFVSTHQTLDLLERAYVDMHARQQRAEKRENLGRSILQLIQVKMQARGSQGRFEIKAFTPAPSEHFDTKDPR